MHDGQCGLCKSSVHPEAIICAACGSRYGYKDVNAPKNLKVAKRLLIACAAAFVFSGIKVYFFSNTFNSNGDFKYYAAMVLSVFFALLLSTIFFPMKKIVSEGEGWWRKADA